MVDFADMGASDRSPHDDHWDAKCVRCFQLGSGVVATGVFSKQDIYCVALQKLSLVSEPVGAPGMHDGPSGRSCIVERLDDAHEYVAVGPVREVMQGLSSGREERSIAECVGCASRLVIRRHPVPGRGKWVVRPTGSGETQ